MGDGFSMAFCFYSLFLTHMVWLVMRVCFVDAFLPLHKSSFFFVFFFRVVGLEPQETRV
jgi:hypothetical protein